MTWVSEFNLFEKLISQNAKILECMGDENTPFLQRFGKETDLELPSYLWQGLKF